MMKRLAYIATVAMVIYFSMVTDTFSQQPEVDNHLHALANVNDNQNSIDIHSKCVGNEILQQQFANVTYLLASFSEQNSTSKLGDNKTLETIAGEIRKIRLLLTPNNTLDNSTYTTTGGTVNITTEDHAETVQTNPTTASPLQYEAIPVPMVIYSDLDFSIENISIVNRNASADTNFTVYDEVKILQARLDLIAGTLDIFHNESIRNFLVSRDLESRMAKAIANLEEGYQAVNLNLTRLYELFAQMGEAVHQNELKQMQIMKESINRQEQETPSKVLASDNLRGYGDDSDWKEAWNNVTLQLESLKEKIKLLDPENGKSRITRETCNGKRRHLLGNSCYYVPLRQDNERAFSWWDGRYLCKSADVLGPDADLVSIETQQEMDDITKLLNNHFGGIEEFWLGGNDLDHEEHWRWISTDRPLTYNNWGKSPVWSPAQNCMSMMPGYNGYTWIDEPCYYERYPICELRLPDASIF